MLSMLVSDFLMNFFKIHDSFLHFFISTKKIIFNYFIGLNSLGPSILLDRQQSNVPGVAMGGGGVVVVDASNY